MRNTGLARAARAHPDNVVPRRSPGRPTGFDEPTALAAACAAARMGATDVEIAKELGVSTATLYVWYGRHPQFLEAVRSAAAIADDRVERSLYQRATGYEIEAEKAFSNGARVTVTEHIPPSERAQVFWLTNRRRAQWKNRVENELVVPDARPTDEPSDRELAMAALALFSEAANNGSPMIEGQLAEVTEDDDDRPEADPDFDADEFDLDPND